MTHQNDGPIFNVVGTSIGAAAGLFNSALLSNIAETAVLAFVGAVVGFATTQALKFAKRKLFD
jgi:H+/Cl- antiporter ClcA